MKEIQKRNLGSCDSQVCSLENTPYYSANASLIWKTRALSFNCFKLNLYVKHFVSTLKFNLFEQNQAHNIDHKDLDNLSLKGDFSITDSILDGNFYFQPQKPPGRLDELLGRRLKKLKKESEIKEYFESLINQYFKNEMNRPCVACMSTKNGTNLIGEKKYGNECMHVSQHIDKVCLLFVFLLTLKTLKITSKNMALLLDLF